jgi:hypothetical protein
MHDQRREYPARNRGGIMQTTQGFGIYRSLFGRAFQGRSPAQ